MRHASCRLTSRISDGAPALRRRVADLQPTMTVGRVHFIHLAARCMRLLGGTGDCPRKDLLEPVHFIDMLTNGREPKC